MKPRFPLRWQFLAVALLNLAVLAVTFLLFIRLEMRQELESFLMATAREKINAVSRQLTLDLGGTPRNERDALLDRYSETYGVRLMLFDQTGERIAGRALEPPPEVTDRIRRAARISLRAPPFLIVTGTPEQYWAGARLPIPDDSGAGYAIGTLVLESPTFWTNPFFFEVRPWLAILAAAMAASILCWLPVVRGLTRTVTQMMKATAAVAEGHFDVRVETARRDELGSLGQSINRMAERLRLYVTGQRRFLGDVAHELRSPLGRMQIAIGILESRTAPEHHAYLADLREEVDAMSALTTELLAFARAELRPDTIALVPVPLRAVVERAVDAEGGSATVAVEIDLRLAVKGDEKYLFRAFSNLLRNAVRYAAADGPIRVAARVEQDRVIATVADSGPGVPEEALQQIFAPFFRPETARDRRTGGTGLGLAIALSSIEACEGSISCRNLQPHGLEVIVVLKPA